MRSALIFCLCVLLCFVAGGCAEEESAQRAVAEKNMDDAMALFNEVDAGFVPAEGDKSTHETVDVFRQDRFSDAAERLEPVLASPSPTQRQAARQLLADVHASAARHTLREAMSNWTNLTGESVDLFNILLSVDRASARVRSFQIDDSELLKQLEEEQLKTKRDLAVDTESASSLAEQIGDLERQIAQLRKKRDDAVAEGRRYRDEAFPLTGEQRYKLYEKASDIEREGQKLFTEAQLQSVDLKGLKGDQAVLLKKIETRKRYLTSIEDQIKVTVARAGELRASLDEAQTTLADTIRRLETRIDKIAANYQQQVDTKFAEAESRIDEAVAILIEAADDDAGPHFDRRNVKLELLGKVATKVYILTSHVLAVADFGQTLAVIAGRAAAADRNGLMYERAGGLRQSANQIAEKQGRLIGQTLLAMRQGKTLADELTEGASDGDTVAEIANGHSLRLTEFRNQIDTLKLPGLPDNLDMLMPIEVATGAGGADGGSTTTTATPVPVLPTIDDAKLMIEIFVDALKDNDVEMASEFTLQPSDDDKVARYKKGLEELAKGVSSGDISVNIGDGKMQGKWAVVAVTFKRPGGETTREMMLYLKGNEWKIVDESARGDAAIKPLFDSDAEALFEWYRDNH